MVRNGSSGFQKYPKYGSNILGFTDCSLMDIMLNYQPILKYKNNQFCAIFNTLTIIKNTGGNEKAMHMQNQSSSQDAFLQAEVGLNTNA